MSENNGKETFKDLYQKFLRHLVESGGNIPNISRRFGALNSNAERVNFVLEFWSSSSIQVPFLSDGKDDVEAVRLRERGNRMFKVKKLKEAWEFYTRSVCFAEDGVNLGLAYANRSAVLFEAHLREECLMDVERALRHHYPEHLKSKLLARKKNCHNLDVSVPQGAHEEVPSVAEQNLAIECASRSVYIQEDPTFGRFIVASKDIKPGEVLAVERPFASLLVTNKLSHCHECLSLCYNLIPCTSCSRSLYCSEICRNGAFDRYHKHECAILASIDNLELDKLKVLPLRIALLVNDSYQVNQQVDLMQYRSCNYKEIHHLVANTSQRSVSDLFERAVAAAVIFMLVKEHTVFFDSGSDNLENFFKEVILLHMQTGPSNFHEISELSSNATDRYELEEVACGAFAFLSLLNHSCCPNVTRFCYGSTVVLRAIQSIKKGEQCFDNYGYHFAVMNKADRRKHLKDQYYFECACVACEHDWGLYLDLPSDGGDQIDHSDMERLGSADVETAKRVIEEKLEQLGEARACRSFCEVQEVVKQCFAIFGSKRRLF